jgi:hypothetical protein
VVAEPAKLADPTTPSPTRVQSETTVHAATATATAAQVAAAVEPAPLSNSDLIALLTDPVILTETPDAVSERLRPVGKFVRSTVFSDSMELEAKRAPHRVVISYMKRESGWLFMSLRIDLYPTATLPVKALYEATDKGLRKRFNKPLWAITVEGSDLKAKAYRVGKTLELSLAEGEDEEHSSLISLELGEPQAAAAAN